MSTILIEIRRAKANDAAGELLRNVAGRTEWSLREREDEAAGRAALLERMVGAGWPGEVGGPGAPDASLTDALVWAQGELAIEQR